MESGSHTVGAVLARATERLAAAGSESARLDAEVLMAHVLGFDRSALIAHPAAPLGSGQLETFERDVERRASGEPVAYIRGMKEFYGVAISVDPRVLIPRPETETLVELAVERIRADLSGPPRPADAGAYLVWDIGTGSGAIAVAIAMELRKRRFRDAVHFHLSDASEEAMAVATLNSVAHGLADLMTFAHGDLTQALPGPAGRADLLVSNLPYIPSAMMPDLPIAASFEPALALDGGDDGLELIRRLLPHLPDVLAGFGVTLLEIGGDQADAVRQSVLDVLPDWSFSIHPDLSGSPRVAELRRPRG